MLPTGGHLNLSPMQPPPPHSHSHLLEVTVISAQDLFPAVKSSMHSYAIASISPATKLCTRTDPAGHTEPTWNDKLSFRLDDATLRSETSSITFDIYAARSKLRLGPDTLLGTARVLLSTLQPTLSVRVVALQVRRPSSLRPQGILNVGIALADAYAKSLPLYVEERVDGNKGKEEMAVTVASEQAKVSRSQSVRAIEMKLEKWRMELPKAKNEEERERVIRIGKGRSRRTTTGRIPWFGTGHGEEKGRG